MQLAVRTPQEVVARIRQLIAQGKKCNETARITNTRPWTVSRISSGERHTKVRRREVPLSTLGLALARGKLCRKCGEPRRVKTFRGWCVECEILELGKSGVVEIAE